MPSRRTLLRGSIRLSMQGIAFQFFMAGVAVGIVLSLRSRLSSGLLAAIGVVAAGALALAFRTLRSESRRLDELDVRLPNEQVDAT